MVYPRLHVGRSLRSNANTRYLNVLIVPLFPLWIIGAFCVKDGKWDKIFLSSFTVSPLLTELAFQACSRNIGFFGKVLRVVNLARRCIELDSRAKGLPSLIPIAFPRDKRPAKYTAGSSKRSECVGGFSDGNISTPTDQSQPSRSSPRCRRTVPKVTDGRSASHASTKKVLPIGSFARCFRSFLRKIVYLYPSKWIA